MSQVSKRQLNKDIEVRVLNTLWDALSYVHTASQSQRFLEDLLTPTEKVMLSKRLTIAVLLIKGYPYESICSVLKVSSATIGSVANWLKISGAGYRYVIDQILKEEKWTKTIDLIDEFLHRLPLPRGKKVFLDKPVRIPLKSRTI